MRWIIFRLDVFVVLRCVHNMSGAWQYSRHFKNYMREGMVCRSRRVRQNLLGYCRRWAHTIGEQSEQPYDFFVDINDRDGGEQHIKPILMALSKRFNNLTGICVSDHSSEISHVQRILPRNFLSVE